MKKIWIIILLMLLLMGCGPTVIAKKTYFGFNNSTKYTIKLIGYGMVNGQYVSHGGGTIVKPQDMLTIESMVFSSGNKTATKVEFYKVDNNKEKLCHVVEFSTPQDIIGFDDGVVYEDKIKRDESSGEEAHYFYYYLSPKLDSDVWK